MGVDEGSSDAKPPPITSSDKFVSDAGGPTSIPSSASFEIDVDALMDAREASSIRVEPTTVVQRTENSNSATTGGTSVSTNTNSSSSNSEVIVPKARSRRSKSSESESSGVPLSPSLQVVHTSGRSSASSKTFASSNTSATSDSAVIVPQQQQQQQQAAEPGQMVQRTSEIDETAKRAALLALDEEDEEQQKPSPSNNRGAALGPNSREAREHRKMRQQQQLNNEAPTAPPVASLPAAGADSIPPANRNSDHLAALALARQDLQAKTNQTGAEEAVAGQRRKAGEEEPPAPAPAPPQQVPVGAFRIQPSTSGRFAIQSAADADVSVSPTEATPSTNNTPPAPVIESNVVLESTLVEEDDEINRSARRRHRRNTDSQSSKFAVDEESQILVPAAIKEETAPLPPPPGDSVEDSSGVILIEAETPTLNDSVWTLLKSRKGRWGIIVLIALVATLTVLGVTVWEKKNVIEEAISPPTTSSPTLAPTLSPTISAQPSESPTLAPTSAAPTASPTIRQLALQDLPNSTITLIESQPDSPQARAWKWLQDDSKTDSFIPQAEQQLQRFVLVTLYYATNGPGWVFQRYWLDHETSECDWWPHVTGVTWPYDQGPKVCNLRGGYTDLKVASNSLQGTLPPELGLLPHLKIMDVSDNPGLTGEVPVEVCQAMEENERLEVLISCDANSELVCDCGCTCVQRRLIDWNT